MPTVPLGKVHYIAPRSNPTPPPSGYCRLKRRASQRIMMTAAFALRWIKKSFDGLGPKTQQLCCLSWFISQSKHMTRTRTGNLYRCNNLGQELGAQNQCVFHNVLHQPQVSADGHDQLIDYLCYRGAIAKARHIKMVVSIRGSCLLAPTQLLLWNAVQIEAVFWQIYDQRWFFLPAGHHSSVACVFIFWCPLYGQCRRRKPTSTTKPHCSRRRSWKKRNKNFLVSRSERKIWTLRLRLRTRMGRAQKRRQGNSPPSKPHLSSHPPKHEPIPPTLTHSQACSHPDKYPPRFRFWLNWSGGLIKANIRDRRFIG